MSNISDSLIIFWASEGSDSSTFPVLPPATHSLSHRLRATQGLSTCHCPWWLSKDSCLFPWDFLLPSFHSTKYSSPLVSLKLIPHVRFLQADKFHCYLAIEPLVPLDNIFCVLILRIFFSGKFSFNHTEFLITSDYVSAPANHMYFPSKTKVS